MNAAAALAAAARQYEAGQLAEAEALCRQVLLLQPRQAEALYLAGMVAYRQGRSAAAVDLLGRAIAENKRAAHYHTALGMALRATGDSAAAARAYRRALALDPGYADAHLSLGNLQQQAGDLAAAAQSYRRAASLDPNFAEAHFQLATVLHRQGDAAAAASYRRALALRPDYAEALNNLGALLRSEGDLAAAERCFRRVLALRPQAVEAQINLGNTLLEAGDAPGAIALLRQALARDPGNAAGHSDLIFALNFDDRVGPAEHQAERRRWAERHAPIQATLAAPRDLDPARRLRIGYVSANFRSYAASYAFGGVLTHHDPAAVEIFCYSDTRPDQEDEVTACLRAGAAQWRIIAGESDDAVARRIAEDRIDILVDLVGHMVGQRLRVFARKPAPLQITAWGEPTGTGLAAIDYLFADPVLIPPAERALLAERVIDLPGALGYWSPAPLPAPGPLPARAAGYVTFGSFNRRAKLTPAVIRCWAAILDALPAARLVLKNKIIGHPAQQQALRAAFAAVGIAPERLELQGQTTREAHFAAYRAIDIALDPFPHSGGMTTLDALAMGLPVIAKRGPTIISRLAASCLAALDLGDFLAVDAADYIARAVALARDLDRLELWRAELPRRLAAVAVGDPARYARAVEAAYRTAWRDHCARAAAAACAAPARPLH